MFNFIHCQSRIEIHFLRALYYTYAMTDVTTGALCNPNRGFFKIPAAFLNRPLCFFTTWATADWSSKQEWLSEFIMATVQLPSG